MSKHSMTMNSMCTHFKGPWWLSVPIPSSQRQGMGEEDLKHLSEKLSIAFRPIYCPPIFSISSTPILGFHYTPRYNGLMRKWKLKILNCLEKYTRKQRDSFFPSHFCLQSAWHCWAEAFADKVRIKEQLCHPGSSSHCAPQTHARNVDSQKMKGPNLLPPYHILAEDTFPFNTEDKCLQILLANI